MLPKAAYAPDESVIGEFNTFDPSTGAPITLAGTPSLRLNRFRSGVWSEITGAGITLRVDEDDTGRHEYEIDLDDANIAAAADDEYTIAINVGTVDGNSVVGVVIDRFTVAADGLTTAQVTGVENAVWDADRTTHVTEDTTGEALTDTNTDAAAILVDTAEIESLFGAVVSDSINDASATATGFTVTTNVGSDTRVGFLRLTSGALEGESRLVSWTDTTVAVLSDASMPTALKQFSAAPANSVTFDFRPL